MDEGNTEGTPKPGDSVETARGESVNMSDLVEVCKTVHSVRDLAKSYGVSAPEMSMEMKRQGIIKHTRVGDVDWSGLVELYQELQSVPAVARRLHTTEKITYSELNRRGIQLRPRGHLKGQKKTDSWREASAKNWDDPVWRQEQRRKWLERLPTIRGTGGISPPERFLHKALRKAHISFKANAVLLDGRYVVDILISQKQIIIEADGSSHYLNSAKAYDAQRTDDLTAAGYEVFRFDYRDIDADPDECVRRLIAEVGLTPESAPTFSERSDKQAFGERMNNLRDDPEWRANWVANLRAGQRKRREQERQIMIQSGLHGPREDMQRSAEMTDPLAPTPIDGDGSSER